MQLRRRSIKFALPYFRCAHVANLKAADWAVNGVGRNYSHSFGYGIMDATCMVRLAKAWKSVGEKKMCSHPSQDSNTIIPGEQVGCFVEWILLYFNLQ